jgi:hypothetical protein
MEDKKVDLVNVQKSSFKHFLKDLVAKVNFIYSKNVLIFNTMCTKAVFATRNALHKSLLNMPRDFKKLHRSWLVIAKSERGDVPGWVLVVLMTTGLVTGIWTVAQPRLSSILKNSLDNMNSIR